MVLEISKCCSSCRECRRVATAIGNFAVFLRLSGISLRRYVATAVRNFAVLLRLLGNSRGGKLSGNPLCWCYGCQEFHRAALLVNLARCVNDAFCQFGAPFCYHLREFSRVATAVGN